MKTGMIALVFLMLVTAGPTNGEQVIEDGKLFSQQCNDPNPVNVGFCFGYIMGIADIIADREACFPKGATMDQISMFVRTWLVRRPHLHRYSANSLIVASLKEGYPCPRRST